MQTIVRINARRSNLLFAKYIYICTPIKPAAQILGLPENHLHNNENAGREIEWFFKNDSFC